MPSGTTVTATPSTWIPEPWASNQPERAHAQPVARSSVGAGVGEEPADDADRQADQERRSGRPDAAEDGDEHQRAAVARVGAVHRPGSGPRRTGEQRSHGPAIITRPRPDPGSHAGSVPMYPVGLPWTAP